MQITIVKVGTPESVPTGKGRPYQKLEVLYKKADGQAGTKKLVSFKNPLVFKQMKEANEGDVFEVDSVKDDDGYFQWTAANLVQQAEVTAAKEPAAKESPALPTVAPVSKAPIKLAVAEADRQRWIVRQSSISNAIKFFEGQQVVKSAVFGLAEEIENWVFRPVGVQAAAPVKQVTATPEVVKRAPGRPRKLVPAAKPEDAQQEYLHGGDEADEAVNPNEVE